MAGPYYLNPAADYDPTRDGTDHAGNELTGMGGWIAVQNGYGGAPTIAAGEHLYVKAATFNLQRYVVFDTDEVDLDGAGWANGDVVKDDNGGGEWTGVLIYTDGDDAHVQLDDPYDYGDVDGDHGINNITAVDKVGIDTLSLPGLTWKISGSNAGQVHIEGVLAADWSRGYGASFQAVFDGKADAGVSQAEHCLATEAAHADYLHLRNLTFQNASGRGLEIATSTSYFCTIEWCLFKDNTGAGLNADEIQYSNVHHCLFRDNGGAGIDGEPHYSGFWGCVVSGNTGDGLVLGAGDTVNHCLVYDNGGDGINLTSNSNTIVGNVIDGNAGNGIIIAEDRESQLIVGNRITNHSTAGKYGVTQESAADTTSAEDYNVFYGNTADLNNIPSGDHSYGDGANHISDPDADGYVDSGGDHYEVTAGEEYSARNAADEVELNWDGVPAANNSIWLTAGLPIEAPAGGGGGGCLVDGGLVR